MRFPALLAVLALTACAGTSTQDDHRLLGPHVTAPNLRAAATTCADRGYAWIAQTGASAFYCLATNIDDEPEAEHVADVLASP